MQLRLFLFANVNSQCVLQGLCYSAVHSFVTALPALVRLLTFPAAVTVCSLARIAVGDVIIFHRCRFGHPTTESSFFPLRVGVMV